jgi:hypothetical protein
MFSQTNQSNTQQSLFTATAAVKPTTFSAHKTGFTSNIAGRQRTLAVKPVQMSAANKGQFYQFSK